MKKIVIMLICLFLIFNLLPSQNARSAQKKIKKTRIYFYTLGSYSVYFPSEWDINDLHDGKSVENFSPVFGGGYSIINFWNRGFFNLEADYTFNRFDTNSVKNRKIGTLSLNFITDWKVGQSRFFSIFGGLGLGFIHYSKYDYTDPYQDQWIVEEDTQFTISLISGFKIEVAKRLNIRTEIRLFMIPENDYGTYYDEGELRMLQLSTGIEISL